MPRGAIASGRAKGGGEHSSRCFKLICHAGVGVEDHLRRLIDGAQRQKMEVALAFCATAVAKARACGEGDRQATT